MKFEIDYDIEIYKTLIGHIEVVQFDGSMACADFLEKWSCGDTQATANDDFELILKVKTPLGEAISEKGDFIVKYNSKFYSIKEKLFEVTYNVQKEVI